ncbi:MAG: oligosaccharide flippase family protein [Christensenellaceae bacterium]|nr:oligosaccharide flippase family protein [Christensenellaceae bacterium]
MRGKTKNAAGTFASSVALITVFAVLTRAIGFLFRIFLSRILGPEMLGIYQIALSFFTVFLTLVASGLPLAISKRVATKQSGGVVVAGLCISMALSLLACGILFAGHTLLGKLFTDARCISILIVLVPSVFAASCYCVIRAVWWGERRYFLLGVTELMEQIIRIIMFVVMLALAFLFVDLAQIAALSYTVAFFLAAIIVAFMYFKARKIDADKTNTARTQYKPLFKSAAPITGMRLLSSFAMPIIAVAIPMRLISAGWTSAAALSAFGVLIGMTYPLLTIPQTVISSLSTALVPELSSAYTDKNNDKVSHQVRNALKFTLFINFLLLPAFIALGEGIGTFLYAEAVSGIYLSQFAWAMIPISLSQITNAILNSLGRETAAMKNYGIGAVALFASVWFLPKFIGIGALVVGMGACMSIASILNLVLIARLTSKGIVITVISQTLTFALLCIPSVLLGLFTYGILLPYIGLFASLTLCGTATLVVFLALCHIFNIVKFNGFRVKFSS